MKALKPFILLVIFLLTTSCTSIGPKVVVDTPEPAEDIVVVCIKQKDYLIQYHGKGHWVDYNFDVVNSGEEMDCGLMITGEHASVSVMHPIYTGDGSKNYVKGDVKHIVLNKTKLDLLDEQKAKFEAGYWDKHRNPGLEYASNLTGCGFDHQYFEYYSKIRKPDVEHFKCLYHEPMLECFKRSFAITKKYDPQIGTQLPNAEEWMRRMWGAEVWE